MRKFILSILLFTLLAQISCEESTSKEIAETNQITPFVWENANVYFLLTDRFCNGDTANDVNFNRVEKAAPERGFQGGDFQGIIQKLDEGYFENLGVTTLWFSPVMEQIHGGTNEGTGFTYAFHGYWIKDWTSIEPNFGTEQELQEIVDKAHAQGIRVLLDVIMNHTGPVTKIDESWGDDWVRSEPACTWDTYEHIVTCNLVKNLPDIKTENADKPVELPAFLLEKWKKEGRFEKELASLDAFFERTAYPRTPRYYIIKWLIDLIEKYGVDGFRIDTYKHVEEDVWAILSKEAKIAFANWKKENPDKVLDDNEFYLMGETYGYSIHNGQIFNNGGIDVNYFKQSGLNSQINFSFKYDAAYMSYHELFSVYDSILQTELKGYSVLNYITSHDDGVPFDKVRDRAIDGGTRLLLCPGKAQIYYGDESSRNLIIEGTQGDATLRGFMNWDELAQGAIWSGVKVTEVLQHYKRLGVFRKNNPAVGAGTYERLSENPYVFMRKYATENYTNVVVVGLDLPFGEKAVPVNKAFDNSTKLIDYYSGEKVSVKNHQVILNTPYSIVLLGID